MHTFLWLLYYIFYLSTDIAILTSGFVKDQQITGFMPWQLSFTTSNSSFKTVIFYSGSLNLSYPFCRKEVWQGQIKFTKNTDFNKSTFLQGVDKKKDKIQQKILFLKSVLGKPSSQTDQLSSVFEVFSSLGYHRYSLNSVMKMFYLQSKPWHSYKL